MYLAFALGDAEALITLGVLIAGNALLGGVALVVMIRPFMGQLIPTPITPHEASLPMLAGPLVFGAAGIALGFFPGQLGDLVVAPAVASILGGEVNGHLKFALDPLSLVFWLSVATWALAFIAFRYADAARTMLRAAAGRIGWSFDRGFDQAYFGLVRLAARVTQSLTIPTIGIGAGVQCDGQVLVVDDMLGLFTEFRPKFVKRYANLGQTAAEAIAAYAEDVRARRFPGPEHGFADSVPGKA